MKKLNLLMLLGIMSGVMGVVSGGEVVLRVGTSADYPPFEYKKRDELMGFDIDVARRVGEKLGRKVEFMESDFANLIPGLNSGVIEMAISGITQTEERSRNIEFSRKYYEPRFAVLEKVGGGVKRMGDLGGKRVGVQLGSTMELLVKEWMKQSGGKAEVVTLMKNTNLVQDLKKKKGGLDVVILEVAQAREFAKANGDLEYRELGLEGVDVGGYGIGFKKGSGLKGEVDRVLEEMERDGEMGKLYEKWFGGKEEDKGL